MQKLSELAGRDLRWVKAERQRGGGHELRDGDETVATLRFRSSWGSFATAESADGCWTFKRVGFLQTRAREPLVRFRKISGLLSLSSSVEITPAGTSYASAPWLVMLGWYLTIQMHNDAATVAASV